MFVRVTTLAISFVVLAFSFSVPLAARADDAPDLDTSQTWLVSVLPAEHAGTTGLGPMVNEYEYSYNGCMLHVEQGMWSQPWPNPAAAPSPLNLPMTEVVFEARAGLQFAARGMDHDERLHMKSAHPDQTGTFTGHVYDIDFGLVRSDSFQIQSGWTLDLILWQDITNGQKVFLAFDDSDLASRVATAIQHISELCGAHSDPF